LMMAWFLVKAITTAVAETALMTAGIYYLVGKLKGKKLQR